MTRARFLIAVGAVLIVMSLVVNVPLHGWLGFIATAVVSMSLFIAGVALLANQLIQLRRFKDR
jgi:predicted phage tail protein